MIDTHTTSFLKRLAIIGSMVVALYFVYTAGYDRGARATAATYQAMSPVGDTKGAQ